MLEENDMALSENPVSYFVSHGSARETTRGTKISSFTPEQLLGPLNDVEQKFAPQRLYVTGVMEIPLPTPRAAIVGSRKPSSDGLKAAREIASEFVRNGVIVVSGLAEGIDTAVHTAAIEEGGHTIAVLGTPLDRVYPRSNFELQEIIKRYHLAISQFPIEQRTAPEHFIFRNRTMALISNATIIVEAKDDSGSLHQGWEALRLGRPLFIWKSVLDDKSLIVPKKMLEYGAMRLSEPEQVLQFLPSQGRVLEIAQ
jgi:DNA processing protein